MENANLMLLCNTSESDVKNQDLEKRNVNEPNLVKVKAENEEINPTSSPLGVQPITDSYPTGEPDEQETNTNNNRASYDDSSTHTQAIEDATADVQPLKSSDEQDVNSTAADESPGESSSSNRFEISVKGNSGSSLDIDLPNNTGSISKDQTKAPTAEADKHLQHHYSNSTTQNNYPDNSYNRFEENRIQPRPLAVTAQSYPFNQPDIDANRNREISARKDLSSQFYVSDQPHSNEFQHNASMYMQVGGNLPYEPVPAMDTLADTAVMQMSRVQQQAFEQAQLEISQQTSIGRSGISDWNHPGQDSQYGFPIASSTPEVDGRRFGYVNQGGQLQSDANLIQAYQALQSEQEQMNWMANNMQGYQSSQQSNVMYDHTAGPDRNWNVQQSAPLDMTPGSTLQYKTQQEHNTEPRMLRERPSRSLKRSHSSGNTNDDSHHASKAAKGTTNNGENYQISTNVHTLKPRHMISWYIDHLIQENENITQISKSYTVPVNILNSKDMYFMDSVLKRTNFPSPKFLEWMQGNFPNINIHAIDFSEGRQPYFHIPFEDQIRGKERNDIIKDVFFYFQHKAMR